MTVLARIAHRIARAHPSRIVVITVIGIAAVPFVVLGLFCAGLFGKAVVLTWLGRRCLGTRSSGALAHPVVGAARSAASSCSLLYLVPVLGFIVYKLLGLLGLGAVVYTLILSARAWRAARGDGPGASAPAPPRRAAATAPAPSRRRRPRRLRQIRHTAPGAGSGAGVSRRALPHRAASGYAWQHFCSMHAGGISHGVLHHAFHMELLVLAAYGAVMWKLRGSTIGGIVFDLQVVRMDGRAVDWETAIVRALACFLSLAVVGLGFFWIAFDDAKQAWHDKIAGTVVVRVAKRVSLV